RVFQLAVVCAPIGELATAPCRFSKQSTRNLAISRHKTGRWPSTASVSFGEAFEIPVPYAPLESPYLALDLALKPYRRPVAAEPHGFWPATSLRVARPYRLRAARRRARTAFKSCRNKSISNGLSIRGLFEVASLRPGKAFEAEPELFSPP